MKYLECEGVDIRGALKKIKKADDPACPVYEAITNAIDAIRERDADEQIASGIDVEFHFRKGLLPEGNGTFSHIVVSDNGIGLNDSGFTRLSRLFDSSKGPINKGSGRVQFVKFFATTNIESVYEENGAFFSRKCVLSANETFLKHNAILSYDDAIPSGETANVGARVTFNNIVATYAQYYESLSLESFRDELLSRYLLLFSSLERALRITLAIFKDGEKTDERILDGSDFIKPLVENIHVGYKSLKTTDKGPIFVEREDKGSETFVVSVFRLPKERQGKNEDFFTSRGERIENANLKILSSSETLGDDRLLVAISGRYIDSHVSETRERLHIPSDSDLKRNANTKSNTSFFLDDSSFITLDDIRKNAVEACLNLLPEIKEKRRKQKREIEFLGKTFGFLPATAREVSENISLRDSPKGILIKLHRCEAEKAAKMDESLFKTIRRVEDLDPAADDYKSELLECASRLLKSTPERNRLALSHYIARRKVVLDVFEKALKRDLTVQEENGRRSKDEALLHNVIFTQKATEPFASDLWMLEDEFLYYSGTSDVPLKDVECNGVKLLRDISECSEEDREYLTTDGKNRTLSRPDILVFPAEAKCVVVEFKAPGVDLSKCIEQLKTYVSLICEFGSPECKITRFYSYLIGDKIVCRDLQRVDPELVDSKSFGYMFVTHPVKVDGKEVASNYMEIHTYESLLARAKARNRIFFDFLFNDV